MRPLLAFGAVFVLAAVAGCDRQSPVRPSSSPGAPVQVTSLSITGLEGPLVAGSTATLRATARMSDGVEFVVLEGAQWMSHDSDIARIDANGTLTAVREGQTTISAGVKGAEAAVTVNVLMDLTGLWRIIFIPVSCPSFHVPGCTGRHNPRPTQQSDLLAVSQNGDRVSGGGWMEFDGIIAAGGRLVLNGRRCYSSDHAFDSEAVVRDWEMERVTGTDTFTGRAHWEYVTVDGPWGLGLCNGKRISNTHVAGDLRILELRRIEK